MAEIRCPMCGKLNPDKNETCQFCEARLKPLVISPEEEEDRPKDTSSLTPDQVPTPKDTSDLEGLLPPWLREIRGQKTEEFDRELSSLYNDADSPQKEADWLESLRSIMGDDEEAGDEESPREQDDQDWLQRIRDLQAADVEDKESQEEEDILPDWLPEDLARPLDEQELTETPPEVELPDWLIETRQEKYLLDEEPDQEEPDHTVQQVREPGPEFDSPAAEETPPPDEHQRDEISSPEEQEQGERGEFTWASDFPEWFSDKKDRGEETPADSIDAGQQPSPEEEDQDEDLASWLGEMESGTEHPPEETGKIETLPDEGQLRDWMDGEETPSEKEQEPLLEEDELPDWLGEGDIDDISSEEQTPADENALPGWLDDLTTIEEPGPDPASPLPDEEETPPAGEELPEWIEEQSNISPSSQEAAADQPDWLLEEETESYVEPFDLEGAEEDLDDNIFDSDLPDWLSEVAFDDLEVDDSLPADISPGELPGWVQAMRPVDETEEQAEAEPEEPSYIEKTGPLAGIPNILLADTDISKLQDSDTPSFKLNITEAQQQYTDLLTALIQNESKPREIPPQRLISTQRMLRWIIAIILVLTVGGVLFSGYGGFNYPTQPPETIALHEAVQSLEESDRVLIAFDYEPAMSGEMNAVAAGVIDHLIQKKIALGLVSTIPTGPALAENFLTSLESDPPYIHTQDYVNLGYVPGEAAGLLSFSISPRKISPLAFDGGDAWLMPPLQGIDRISDFSMIMVVTDDPEKARLWVEQVGPTLADTPLMMVVSAQVEPLVRPYYHSTPRQVSGMVAGVAGGANYEEMIGRGRIAQSYWDAFSVGIAITLILILTGGLVNGILYFLDERNQEGRA